MDLTGVRGFGDMHSQALGRGVITDSLPSRASLPARAPVSSQTMAAPSPLPSQCTLSLCVSVTSLLLPSHLGGQSQPLETGLVLGSQAAALRPQCLTEGPGLDLTHQRRTGSRCHTSGCSFNRNRVGP